MRLIRLAAGAGGVGVLGVAGYVGLVTGAVTLDLGIGRRVRPLGPLTVEVDAPRTVVYAAACAPYATRRTRAMQQKVEILERGESMLLAAHRTPIFGGRLTAVTTETVTFDPPHTIGFRLLRGPVPHVTETFTFTEHDDRTLLRYDGELGTDLWSLGARWGNLVARAWTATVKASFADIKTESERRAHLGTTTPAQTETE